MGTESALAILRTAIHNEVTGQRFYLDASLRCIDPRAKETFAGLADDEGDHTRLLLLEYEALSEHGQWIDPASALSSSADIDTSRIAFASESPSKELFPPDRGVHQLIDRRSDDMDALAVGVHMEIQAIELYSQAAAAAQEDAAKEAYEFLILEETRHLQQLKDQWQRLAGIPWP